LSLGKSEAKVGFGRFNCQGAVSDMAFCKLEKFSIDGNNLAERWVSYDNINT